jgi:hypothetical protein
MQNYEDYEETVQYVEEDEFPQTYAMYYFKYYMLSFNL